MKGMGLCLWRERKAPVPAHWPGWPAEPEVDSVHYTTYIVSQLGSTGVKHLTSTVQAGCAAGSHHICWHTAACAYKSTSCTALHCLLSAVCCLLLAGLGYHLAMTEL